MRTLRILVTYLTLHIFKHANIYRIVEKQDDIHDTVESGDECPSRANANAAKQNVEVYLRKIYHYYLKFELYCTLIVWKAIEISKPTSCCL